jgi:hypothetical protein
MDIWLPLRKKDWNSFSKGKEAAMLTTARGV